jgi:preprotein translocase subunit Sec63
MDSASLEEDWYAVLEVHGYASESDIKQAFRRLALLCHPDKNRGNEAASAVKFVQVTMGPPPPPKKKKKKTKNTHTSASHPRTFLSSNFPLQER